jgi:hypothetical protein
MAQRTHKNFSGVLICGFFILSTLCFSGCINDDQETVVVMTMWENIQDYQEIEDTENHTFTGGYRSLDDGDTLIIKDAIGKLIYDDNAKVSYLEFETLMGYPLAFQGDITYQYRPTDLVALKVHIIKVTFVEQQDDGELWTIEFETFEEGWDSSDDSIIPIHPRYLSPR